MPDPVHVLVFSSFALAVVAIGSLALNRGANATLPLRKGNDGYWGAISSSVDWCEENYMHSTYVAETHNTISSAIIALVGAAGVECCHGCSAEGRYWLLSVLLIVIGLGSMAFHGALRHWMQMLDEVPMLWLVVAATFCTLEHEAKGHGGRQYGAWLPAALLLWAAVISATTILLQGGLQVICFHAGFASAELVALYGVYRLYRDTTDAQTRRICRGSFALFALSILCWSADGLLCARLQNLPWGLPNPQLHAWGWHILVAAAAYGLLVASLMERLGLLGRRPRVVWRAGCWPVVAADPLPPRALRGGGSGSGAALKARTD
eukprot:TRINITY_DN5004_c0_g1_i4.p1 TRINITY_DN5004_c0_g1~~TRINITY_DN5004_c0_g1_i4.p1  ORF type:complete len:372 (+),score=103.85 TRINITY_DN5004_c0_g1_i4:155-1117(+)